MTVDGVAFFTTGLGRCAIAWSDRGIVRVQLPEKTMAQARARLTQALGPVAESAPPKKVARVIARVQRHLSGARVRYDDVALDLDAVTPFRRAIYLALRDTAPGQTLSYAELAAQAGSPKAARAVGSAMAHNPLPIVVPCHRVLAAGGKPGGFSAYGGTVTKAKLLALEGVALEPQTRLFVAADDSPIDGARAVRELRKSDPRLGPWIDRVGPLGLRLEKSKSTFAALSEAIVYQQLTAKAASTIFARVVAAVGGLSPEAIARAKDDTLRGAGLSRAKAAALRDLAQKTLAGEVPPLSRLRKMSDDDIVETLIRVRGVGRWTAHMLLIFRLGRPDVLPVDDLGVRKGFARVMNSAETLPTPKELAAYGERWRPWRSVASWYLWRVLDL
jgi:methylated-DNA-[protein]-cysteine S-methyltransferase